MNIQTEKYNLSQILFPIFGNVALNVVTVYQETDYLKEWVQFCFTCNNVRIEVYYHSKHSFWLSSHVDNNWFRLEFPEKIFSCTKIKD